VLSEQLGAFFVSNGVSRGLEHEPSTDCLPTFPNRDESKGIVPRAEFPQFSLCLSA
jgi:hypothetical protein